MYKKDSFNIFVADDNRAYHRLIKSAWNEMNPLDKLFFSASGQELVERLKVCREDATKTRPDMVLLDLEMPEMDGKETLMAIKADLEMHLTPVVMLTSSHDPEDVNFCYRMGCSSYLVKPEKYQELTDSLDQLRRFCFEVSKIPSRLDLLQD